jgi:hypothetical protein
MDSHIEEMRCRACCFGLSFSIAIRAATLGKRIHS